MESARIADGLWRWTAEHPRWEYWPGHERLPREAGCVYYEAAEATVLFDPLVPAGEEADFFRHLDADVERRGLLVVVLLTAGWHRRSADELVERYDARLGGPPPDGVEELPIEGADERQDQFALGSQQKASAAQKAGRFKDEIAQVTVKGRRGDVVVTDDEYIRHDASLETMAKLRPAFNKDGTVTAANASGINDGAAALVLMGASEAAKRGLKPLARIEAFATAGVDPAVMGTGPIPATRKVLERAGWKVEDLDLIEANEAFAAQALAVNKDLGWDSNRVNVNGGAIAIGHPIGASGARILITLLHEMQKRDAKKGLATLCIGGGMGVAMCVER